MLRCCPMLVLFFSALILLGCGSKSRKETEVDSTQQTLQVVDDSAMFVGAVTALNKNELYVDLYLKDSIVYNDELHEFFQGSTDSVIYQDDQIKRSQLPDMIAREYFNLIFLDQLDLYDSLGRHLGKTDLQRVEFLEDFIEVRIVGSYKASFDVSHARYGIGGDVDNDHVERFSYTDINDPRLTKAVKSHVQSKDTAQVPFMIHRKFNPGGAIYSFVSDYQKSFIFDHATSEVVYLKENEMFMNILPVPKQRNGRLVFLATVNEADTDIVWTTLLVFNGKEYTQSQYQRLSKPDLQ